MKLYDYIKRKRYRKRVISATLVATLLIAIPAVDGLENGDFWKGLTVYATSAQNKKNQAQSDLDDANNKIDDLTGQQSEVEGQLSDAAAELADIISAQELLQTDMDNKQIEIDQANEDLTAAQKQEQEQYDAMKLRIQFMYENSTGDSIWTAILQSDGISDMLNRIEYVSQVYTSDRDLMDTYQATVQQVSDLTVQLQTEMDDMVAMQESFDEQETYMESVMDELKEQSSDYEAQIAAAQAVADQKTKEIAEANAEIKRQQEAEAKRQQEEAAKQQAANNSSSSSNSNSSSSSSSSGSGQDAGGGSGSAGTIGDSSYLTDDSVNPSGPSKCSGSDIVAYGQTFVGNKYLWGGNDPNTGADCSGFVTYVLRHFGYSLSGRPTSITYRSWGNPVSYNNMQPGDIVCYPGHVAIYAGGGVIVEAQSTKAGITYGRSVNCHTILAIRRAP